MNKCLMRYATIMFCIINAMTFGYGEKTPLGLHAKLSKGSTIFTPQQWKAAKVTGGLAATAGISYLAEQCVKDGSGKEFYNGKYAWGYAQALKLSSLCLSVSPMFNEAWGDQFFRFGTRAPIVGMAAIVVAHPTTQKLAAWTPILGEHISTYTKAGENKCGTDCQGICIRCFIPKTLVIVGIYKAIDPLVDKIGTAVGKKLGFIHEDETQE